MNNILMCGMVLFCCLSVSSPMFSGSDEYHCAVIEAEPEQTFETDLPCIIEFMEHTSVHEAEETAAQETKEPEQTPEPTHEVKTPETAEQTEAPEPMETSYSGYGDIMLTEDEYCFLAKVVFAEAGSGVEPQENRIGVVQVIFNRMLSDRFPNTLEGVITQSGQFSCYPYCLNSVPTEDCYKAIDAVLTETDLVIPNDVCYFSTTTQGRQLCAKIGGHCFCY